MFFTPLTLLLFFIFIFAFLFLFLFIHIGIITIAFERIGLTEGQTFAFLLISLLGSNINIPIKKIPLTVHESFAVTANFFGMKYPVPVRNPREMIIAINVGGAIVPLFLSAYLMAKWGILLEPLFGIFSVAVVCYFLAKPVPGLGIALPVFVPPLMAAFVAVFMGHSVHAPSVAYISATMGTLLGADILHLKDLKKIQAPVASIGGAGTFDGIFLAGIIAVLLA
ncbi:MAG: hypothetical protein DSZ23_00960 [Thermodesulfatator sp.]|nr:MAG: hypothetical protein DSZ23_00960 [Thermodesulfatator sp.]